MPKGKSVEVGGIRFFESGRRKAVPVQQAESDVLIQYLGHLRFYTKGAEQWGEVSRLRGMFETARRAQVGYLADLQKLVLVPALMTDAAAFPITWGARMRSGDLRLRSAFVHYGIYMERDEAWALKAEPVEYPEVGWALTLDLGPVHVPKSS